MLHDMNLEVIFFFPFWLPQKLFKDLINSLFLSVQEENDQLSSLMCQTLLMGLHKEMTEKVEKLLLSNADDDEDSYAYQSPGHKV